MTKFTTGVLIIDIYEYFCKLFQVCFFPMIRIPFSAHSEAASPSKGKIHPFEGKRTATQSDETQSGASETERVEVIEARLAALERKLVRHAEDLKVQVSDRVLRIQSRLENAMKPFEVESPEMELDGNDSNILSFAGEFTQLHHLHATNGCTALNDLNQTLKATREHLEALASSVERMKRSVSKRSEDLAPS
jgi:hypothetical protein